jgi:hypothetical protein
MDSDRVVTTTGAVIGGGTVGATGGAVPRCRRALMNRKPNTNNIVPTKAKRIPVRRLNVYILSEFVIY